MVTDGRSHQRRPNRSVPPDVLRIQHFGVIDRAFFCKSKRLPPGGTARYRRTLTSVGVRPKCRSRGGSLPISTPRGGDRSAMVSRTVRQRARLPSGLAECDGGGGKVHFPISRNPTTIVRLRVCGAP